MKSPREHYADAEHCLRAAAEQVKAQEEATTVMLTLKAAEVHAALAGIDTAKWART